MAETSAPVQRGGCPYIGPFGWCENSGCSNSINGICWWLNQTGRVSYSNETGPEQGNVMPATGAITSTTSRSCKP